jgi:hypothetical protein
MDNTYAVYLANKKKTMDNTYVVYWHKNIYYTIFYMYKKFLHTYIHLIYFKWLTKKKLLQILPIFKANSGSILLVGTLFLIYQLTHFFIVYYLTHTFSKHKKERIIIKKKQKNN